MEVIGHGPQAREWEQSWEDTLKEWRLGRICTHGRGLEEEAKRQAHAGERSVRNGQGWCTACNPLQKKHHLELNLCLLLLPPRNITPIPVGPGLSEQGSLLPKYLDGKKNLLPFYQSKHPCLGGPQSLLPTYLTPRNWGCSPGALVSVSILRLSMWAMEMTVAATYQGSPMKEHTAMRMPTQNRSRW